MYLCDAIDSVPFKEKQEKVFEEAEKQQFEEGKCP